MGPVADPVWSVGVVCPPTVVVAVDSGKVTGCCEGTPDGRSDGR